MYSSFDAHKSRDHPNCGVPDFKNEIILTETKSQPMQSQAESDEDDHFQSSPVLDAPECVPLESVTDTGELQAQLRNNLASMFLKMHSVLHVSETAIQHIVENLAQILSLSKPLVRDSVIRVFQEHGQSISNAVFKESVEAVMQSSVFVSATTKGAELSTAKRRKTFVQTNYLLVMLEHYTIDSSGHKAVYVPMLQMIQCLIILMFLRRFKKPNYRHLECT